MSEKQVAGTVFGDVEYEIVTCSSCGQEELKDEAHQFVIGNVKRKRSRFSYYRFEFHDGSWTSGWACRNCADDSPVGFPVSVSFWERLKWLFTGKI